MREKAELRRSIIALTIFGLLIAAFALVNTSVKTEIKGDVPLDIYENGVVVGETSVHIDGQRGHFLVGKQEDYFSGRFEIELIDRTCNEHYTAHIEWMEDGREYQTIMYFGGGDFFLEQFGLNHVMLVNPTMTEMVIQMRDGRVLASSEAVYNIYMEHFTYNSANGTTGFSSGIPEF